MNGLPINDLISIAVKSVPIRVESMQEAVLLGLEFVVHVSIFKFNKDKIHFFELPYNYIRSASLNYRAEASQKADGEKNHRSHWRGWRK